MIFPIKIKLTFFNNNILENVLVSFFEKTVFFFRKSQKKTFFIKTKK